jgi:hypothetical protein
MKNTQWSLKMNTNMDIKNYRISASESARASKFPLLELDGWSRILFLDIKKI